MPTQIEWCDEVWNWLTGCSRISSECQNCYAAVAAASPRLQAFPQYQGVEAWDGTVHFVESQLKKPLKWVTPKRIFTCSMSDVFHENVPDEWRDRAFAVMAIAPQHTYQILTKRTQRMFDYFNSPNRARWITHKALDLLRDEANPLKWRYGIEELKVSLPFHHVWLGTTAGCQQSVGDRLPILSKLTQQGWTTFVSAEPLLEPINLGFDFPGYKVSQVITGAESGKGARPMDEDWVRSIRDQCLKHDTAFFYKQNFVKGKKVHLPELDGQQWTQFPANRPVLP